MRTIVDQKRCLDLCCCEIYVNVFVFSSLNRDRPHILPLTQRVCLGKQEDSIVSSDGQLWSMALTTCSHCIRIHQPNQLKIWAFICILSCFQFHCWFLWDRYVQLDFDKMQPLQLHQDESTRWRFIFFYFFAFSYFYTTLGLGKSKVVKMVCEEKIRYLV